MIVFGRPYVGSGSSNRVGRVLLPDDYVIFPPEEGTYVVFVGIEVPSTDIRMHLLERTLSVEGHLLIDVKERRLATYKRELETLTHLTPDEIDQERMKKLKKVLKNVKRGLVDLRNYDSVVFGPEVLKSEVARILRFEEGIVVAVREDGSVYVDGLKRTLSFSVYPYASEEAIDDLLIFNAAYLSWSHGFRTFFSPTFAYPLRLKELISSVLGNIIKDEYKRRLAEFLEDENIQKLYEKLINDASSVGHFSIVGNYGLLAMLNVLGAVYGKEVLERILQVMDSFEGCVPKLTNLELESFLVCSVETLIINLFYWLVIPYRVTEGRVREVILCNPLFNAYAVLSKDGIKDYYAGQGPLSELPTTALFVGDVSIIESLGEWLLSKQVIEKTDEIMRRSFLFNIIEELDDVEITRCKVVNARVKYSTRKLW